MSSILTIEDFDAIGLRIGTITHAELNDGARDAAYKLWVDVGSAEPVQSSAKITETYGLDELVGRQVAVATGFAPIRIGGFRSDVLVIGALTDDGVVLLAPDRPVAPGSAVA